MRNSIILSVCALAALTGCGGSGTSSTPAPSAPPAATITISASGVVTPKSVTVPRGSQVQFVNSDRFAHQMTSNPHPEHTDCPELNQVGFLAINQSRQTGNLNTVRTCGFHDHDLPSNTNLQGTIIIQ